MSHLILATNDRAEDVLRQSGLANVALGFCPRFVWRKLPSDEQLLMGLERRSEKHRNSGDHWLDDVCSGALDGLIPSPMISWCSSGCWTCFVLIRRSRPS